MRMRMHSQHTHHNIIMILYQQTTSSKLDAKTMTRTTRTTRATSAPISKQKEKQTNKTKDQQIPKNQSDPAKPEETQKWRPSVVSPSPPKLPPCKSNEKSTDNLALVLELVLKLVVPLNPVVQSEMGMPTTEGILTSMSTPTPNLLLVKT